MGDIAVMWSYYNYFLWYVEAVIGEAALSVFVLHPRVTTLNSNVALNFSSQEKHKTGALAEEVFPTCCICVLKCMFRTWMMNKLQPLNKIIHVGWCDHCCRSLALRSRHTFFFSFFFLLVSYNDPFGHFKLSISILKLHNTALHDAALLHLTSSYNVPSVETEGIYTEQACGGGSAEGQRSLISFPLHHSTFPPSRILPILLSYFTGWERCTINAPALHVSLNLTPDRFRIFSWCTVYSFQHYLR